MTYERDRLREAVAEAIADRPTLVSYRDADRARESADRVLAVLAARGALRTDTPKE